MLLVSYDDSRAFDGEIQVKSRVEVGIPQGSPISPVLFLIYIRDIFSSIENLKIRHLSYIDNINLLVSSKSIENNCAILKEAAEKLFQSQGQNLI